MTRARKRSASLRLTTMLAGASLTLAGCNDRPAPVAGGGWDDNSVAQGEQVEVFPYQTLEDCRLADKVPDTDCASAYAAARADNVSHPPTFAHRAACVDTYGACAPRVGEGGGFFAPALAGFVVGRMLSPSGAPYYAGTGLYRRQDERDRNGFSYHTGWGGVINRDYVTGRTTVARQGVEPPQSLRAAPARAQTRSRILARGGFGGVRGLGFGG